MTLASTPELARLGFGYQWAKDAYIPSKLLQQWKDYKVFGSKITAGKTTLSSKDVADPKDGFFSMAVSPATPGGPKKIVEFPAYLSGIGSVIDSGAELGNIQVTNADISSAKNSELGLLSEGLQNPVKGNPELAKSLYNLYTIQSPSANSQSESNTLTLSNFLYYNDGGMAGAYLADPEMTYWPPRGGYEGYPNTLSFIQDINPSEITYTSHGKSLKIGEGKLTLNAHNLASGTNLNTAFRFIPGDGSAGVSVFKIDSTITNSVQSSKTKGVTNLTRLEQNRGVSDSNSGSTTAGFNIGASFTAEAKESLGVEEASVSATVSAGYEQSWQQAWDRVATFNATRENSLSSDDSNTDTNEVTDSLSFSVELDLSAAKPTGTKNGTALYNYVTTVQDPSTGKDKTITLDLVPGEEYQWELHYYQGNIQQTVEGDFSISGQLGFIKDSSGNTYGGNVAQAYYYAQAGNAFNYSNADSGIIKSYNTNPYGEEWGKKNFADIKDTTDLKSVRINGSTVAKTVANTNLSLKLTAVSPSSKGSATTASSLAQAFKGGKNSEISIHEGLALQPHETLNPTGYNGNDSSEVLTDSPGQDIIRMGGGHDQVTLSGNTVQENNDGDIVHLGDGNDRLDSKNAEGFNSVQAGTGNDRVVDGKGHLGADLGDGNDTFVHGGGTDYVTLGEGRDKVRIRKNARTTDDTLVVHDFHVGGDFITGLNKNARLQWDSTIQGFQMQGHGDSTIRLHSFGQDDIINPDFWVGLGLQNMYALKLKKRTINILNWEYIRSQYGRYGFSKSSVNYEDWKTFSSSEGNLKQAVQNLTAIEGKGNLSSAELETISDFAQNVDSFHAFIAGTYNILNL